MKKETKKCKYCQTEIPAKATVCPNCKRTLPKNNGCLITVLIFLVIIVIGIIIGGNVDRKTSSDNSGNKTVYQTDDSIAAKYINVTDEEGNKIDNILRQCGITDVTSFVHDVLLDDAHKKGETGYRITSGDIDNIILYLKKDKTVFQIKYEGHKLYAKGSKKATLNDYIVSLDDINKYQYLCEEKVKDILKSPSTAKFPNYTKWGFKKEKNIFTVQGYVDSQNSFGAEIRSKFQFIIDTDSDNIKSFIFDGAELIK